MPSLGLKSQVNRLLKEMLASITGLFPAIKPIALALARLMAIVVLLASPSLSRYGIALPEPFGLFDVRLRSIWNAGAACRLAFAVASSTELPSAMSAVRNAV